jgi:hypothetical protein
MSIRSSRESLTRSQRKALQDYATLTISLEQLRHSLGNAIEIDFGTQQRNVRFHYDNRKPVVHIELGQIREVMDKHSHGEVSTEQISDWAAMLLANPSYDWAGPEEDEIAQWLNEISLLGLKPRQDE